MSGALGALDTVFWGIVTFSILVVIHELGHFLAARAFGVKVHEFMVGLPGPAIRLHTKNMTWGVTAIPLGGYVRIAGMEPGSEDDLLAPALKAVAGAGELDAARLAAALGIDEERADALLTTLLDWKAIERVAEGSAYRLTVDATDPDALTAAELLDTARRVTYRGKSTFQRIVILGMGVFVNLIAAILTFTVVLAAWGYYEPSLTIASVGEGTPAQAAGVLPDDTLVALDGEPLESWQTFQSAMAAAGPGEAVLVTIERAGSKLELPVTLGERDGHGYLGVGPSVTLVDLSIGESLYRSVELTGMVFQAIIGFFQPSSFGESIDQVTGVVGIAVIATDAAKAGPLEYAWLIALLSLSLGAMNIIPIPPLDGGKILLELIEGVLRRPLDRRITIAVSATGAILLFSLIAYIMYVDIARIVT